MEYGFDIELAKKYGLAEAIMIKNFQFWIAKNKANEKNHHDGHYWTFNSVRAYQELFPFLSIGKIRRALKNLIKMGVLIDGNYNQKKYDKTRWYAFGDENEFIKSLCQKRQMDLLKTTNGFVENDKPIPYIKPDNKPDIIYTVNEKNHFLEDSNQIKLAKLLYEKVIEYRKIPKPNFNNWAKWIDKINTELEKSYEEVEHAIIYSQLEENRADKYFPIVQSAQSLYEKYNKLINYKERKNKNGNFKPYLSREGIIDTLKQLDRIQSEPSWLFN